MRTPLILAFVLSAFAANSLLTRAGVAGGADPLAFAALRAVSAAAILLVLLIWRGRKRWPSEEASRPSVSWRPGLPALWLAIYLLGFSFAYEGTDAGTGALILFGTVQVVMFAAALSERPGPRRWAGTALALGGLALLAGGAATPVAVAAMTAAGAGWAFFTLAGRRSADPLSNTAAAFVHASGPLALAWLLVGGGGLSAPGAALALASGAVASGLGYAAWYAVLPRLERSFAALLQLSVPALALIAAWPLLAEVPAPRSLAACALILGGVAFGLVAPARRRIGSGGS